MKYYQLCIGDIITFPVSTEVLFDSYWSDDALNDLSISYEEGSALLKATVPAGTKLIVTDRHSGSNRYDWSVVFNILDYPPFIISEKLRVVISLDMLSILDFTLESKYVEIKFEKDEEAEEDVSDKEDFSHIS